MFEKARLPLLAGRESAVVVGYTGVSHLRVELDRWKVQVEIERQIVPEEMRRIGARFDLVVGVTPSRRASVRHSNIDDDTLTKALLVSGVERTW